MEQKSVSPHKKNQLVAEVEGSCLMEDESRQPRLWVTPRDPCTGDKIRLEWDNRGIGYNHGDAIAFLHLSHGQVRSSQYHNQCLHAV